MVTNTEQVSNFVAIYIVSILYICSMKITMQCNKQHSLIYTRAIVIFIVQTLQCIHPIQILSGTYAMN